MAPTVSICIATFRRPTGLARLLESLAVLKIPADVCVEVLVVDNDADESACSVARSYSNLHGGLRYFVEPRQNIAHARNRALAEAHGRWLMFIDDDEIADPNWLVAYLALFDAHECDGGFGPVIPRLEQVATAWPDLPTFYARPRQPTGTPATSPRSGNAMVRRSLFGDRKFDPAYGRSGGSDTKLFGEMLATGARLLWCDEALVTEFIPAERHRLSWLARRAFRGGYVYSRQNRRNRRLSASVRAGVLLCCFAMWIPFSAIRGRRAAARVWLRCCTQAGHLWSALGRSFTEYAG